MHRNRLLLLAVMMMLRSLGEYGQKEGPSKAGALQRAGEDLATASTARLFPSAHASIPLVSARSVEIARFEEPWIRQSFTAGVSRRVSRITFASVSPQACSSRREVLRAFNE
jgi:hypothetical protein